MRKFSLYIFVFVFLIVAIIATSFSIYLSTINHKQTLLRFIPPGEEVESIVRGVLIRDILTATLGTALIVLVFFIIFRSFIVQPLKQIIEAFKKVREGNLRVKINIKSKNEIGELADNFNKMIISLRESRTELEEAKTILDIRVQARTRELRELTESLEEKSGKRGIMLLNPCSSNALTVRVLL